MALKAGISAAEFWAMTPAEAIMTMRAAADRAQEEREKLHWTVWHIAALTRAKRMPPYGTFYKRPEKPMTPQEAARKRADHERLSEAYKAYQDGKHE